jgi:FtsP/CotA-like multicopper oxidase with cupredoxin domain
MTGMSMGNMTMGDMTMGDMTMGDMTMGDMTMDLNDVDFDAYLANQRTLADPEIVRVEPGGRVRLRVINGAAATNFFLDLGALVGALVAVDGNPVVPLMAQRFALAVAQRLDIRVALPAGVGAYPVLALREGEGARTGIVLATPTATVGRIAGESAEPAPALGPDLAERLSPLAPPSARSADVAHTLELGGDMRTYVWTLNGATYGEHRPLEVHWGQRVSLLMRNATDMAHPMHLHGHHFRVLARGERRLAGVLRDTVLVPAMDSVTIAFRADNPGEWAFHCHNLYHMEAGMMTTLRYVV